METSSKWLLHNQWRGHQKYAQKWNIISRYISRKKFSPDSILEILKSLVDVQYCQKMFLGNNKVPYMCHYNPWFVYFKLTYWRSKTFFQGGFQKILPLCMVSIQEQFLNKSGYIYISSREYRFTHMNHSTIDIPFLSEAFKGERIWVIFKDC